MVEVPIWVLVTLAIWVPILAYGVGHFRGYRKAFYRAGELLDAKLRAVGRGI